MKAASHSAMTAWFRVCCWSAATNPYRVGWEAFLRDVGAGAPIACDFATGIRDVAFAEACHRSMQERRWIALPPPEVEQAR